MANRDEPEQDAEGSSSAAPDAASPVTFPTLREAERAHIALALRLARGHRARTARLLGISERNLYRKIRLHGLNGGE